MSRRVQMYNGSEYVIPLKSLPHPFMHTCCDCGLTHMNVVTAEADETLRIKIYRDDEDTAKERRERRVRKSKARAR